MAEQKNTPSGSWDNLAGNQNNKFYHVFKTHRCRRDVDIRNQCRKCAHCWRWTGAWKWWWFKTKNKKQNKNDKQKKKIIYENKIINEFVSDVTFSFAVSIQHREFNETTKTYSHKHFCGGVLLHVFNRTAYVISASHCMRNVYVFDIKYLKQKYYYIFDCVVKTYVHFFCFHFHFLL